MTIQATGTVLQLRHLLPATSGTVTVGGSIASGVEIANATGGVIAGIVGVVGLVWSIALSNAKRRREYEQEMRAAEARGEERFRRDMEFWRGIALAHLQERGSPVPVPPSMQPDPGEQP